MKILSFVLLALTISLCSPLSAKVDASGKQDVPMNEVPAEVLAVISGAHPDFKPESAEYETRNGNEYFDVEGTGADGLEVEFDMTRIDGKWTIVETQRDIVKDELPGAVAVALSGAYPEFAPDRIIESDQGGGLIIYEFFGEGPDGENTKVEVRFENGEAEVLDEEWEH